MQIHKKVRTISRRIEAYALDQTLYVTHQNPSETILAISSSPLAEVKATS